MKSLLILSFSSLILLFGCVTTNSVRLSNTKYPALEPDQVTIYLTEEDIPGEFVRIAIINAEGNAEWTDQSQLYRAVRKEAAKLGANGVLHAALKEPSAGEQIAGAFFGTGTTRRGEMVAIFVQEVIADADSN